MLLSWPRTDLLLEYVLYMHALLEGDGQASPYVLFFFALNVFIVRCRQAFLVKKHNVQAHNISIRVHKCVNDLILIVNAGQITV